MLSRSTAALGGIAVGRQHARVGHRLEPVRARHVRLRRRSCRPCRPARPRSAARALDERASASRQTLVAMRYSQVRSDDRPVEAVERLPGAQHRLLHRVVGIDDRAEHAVAVPGQRGAMEFQVWDRRRSRVQGQTWISNTHRGGGQAGPCVQTRHPAKIEPVSRLRLRFARCGFRARCLRDDQWLPVVFVLAIKLNMTVTSSAGASSAAAPAPAPASTAAVDRVSLSPEATTAAAETDDTDAAASETNELPWRHRPFRAAVPAPPAAPMRSSPRSTATRTAPSPKTNSRRAR